MEMGEPRVAVTSLIELHRLLIERGFRQTPTNGLTTFEEARHELQDGVYVRQSTPGHVQNNLESQRRQYELVDVARCWNFRDVDLIDDDLGRTASRAVDRPGFERLVSGLCTGKVSAAFVN